MTSFAEHAAQVLQEPGCAPPARPATEVWFRHFYQSHFLETIRLILRFGISHHDAEDLAQRVFMVAHRRRDEVATFEPPGPWLRGVTIRIVREHFRWRRVRDAARWVLEYTWLGYDEDELSPERIASADESLNRIGKVLARMSNKLRETLVLLELEGMTPREAAELLKVPHNTLRSRRALAREEFMRLWEQQEWGHGHD
ncbi:MAG TPA: RNA polymerase sigma factor [Polyangiaceae bacterium]|nr:RNA polymerase sigma factor [Polyangiaceae bacterium]